jgi:cellulose synthase (UDP-forming)
MTESPAWREFEAGDGVVLKLLRFSILAVGIFFLVFAGILELTWPQQAVLGLLTVLLGIWMDRSSTSYLVTLTLRLCSMYSTFR